MKKLTVIYRATIERNIKITVRSRNEGLSKMTRIARPFARKRPSYGI